MPNPFYLKKINVKVPAYHVVNPGMLRSDYCLFHIETEADERHKVQRKDVDFYTLRRVLRAQFPYVLVPPLPKENTKLFERILNKR